MAPAPTESGENNTSDTNQASTVIDDLVRGLRQRAKRLMFGSHGILIFAFVALCLGIWGVFQTQRLLLIDSEVRTKETELKIESARSQIVDLVNKASETKIKQNKLAGAIKNLLIHRWSFLV